MNKFIAPIAALSLVSPTLFAADNPDLEVGMAIDQQLSVVVELDNQYRFTVGNEGAAFDYIIKRGDIEADVPISWYVGVGGWGEWEDDFGARVPLGVKVNFHDGWNAYAQVHPELNLYTGPELQIGGALGVTYKF
ncbi:hypothetical protein EK599_12705 [Vibrio sp. T187]|uniref:hypothetical protein n=1 Tax=Vibrio TaxID=662 RepID=UPI0010C975BA|nr:MULTISPECIES: hypothetical protein [Vibrio]MBW3696557.1 hypothetical protein [Vibrio sp. T187]